jgi:SAM-dependent methyltransferase
MSQPLPAGDPDRQPEDESGRQPAGEPDRQPQDSGADADAALARFGRWMYEFDLGGGVKTPVYAEEIVRVHRVRESMIFGFLDGIGFAYDRHTVLDLGCNEGYFLFEMLRRGCPGGTGVDARADNLAKAAFVRDRLGYDTAELRQSDVFEFDAGTGTFDLVLLLGLIYHVHNPVGLVRAAAAAARRMLILETQLCRSPRPIPFGWGSADSLLQADAYFVAHVENLPDNPLASLGGISLVPNLQAAVETLRQCGFRSIVQLHPNHAVREPQYDRVDRVVLVGVR